MNTAKISNMVIEDIEISDAAFRLYCILVMLAGEDSNQVIARIKKLAEITGKSNRTIRRNLDELISKGLIKRILQKSPDEPKECIPSLFIIHDCIRDKKEA